MDGDRRPGPRACEQPLTSAYDCAMLDLDGVIYVGPQAVPGVPEILDQARTRGMTLAYVTNNAARTPEAVADHLRELGVHATAHDVVTSAQAAAREVESRVTPGANVLVVGGDGLEVALRELGLVPVRSFDNDPQAVVQGFHPTVGWRALAEGARAASAGLPWVASNTDLTIPTAHGIAPGNGTLVNAIAAAAGRRPDVVAGKPFRPLFDETVRRIGCRRPLVVGDRLDTDIEGAVRCGADSLLVLTGVTGLEELCRAAPDHRPTYVAWTMDGLLRTHPVPELTAQGWRLNGWCAAVDDGRLRVLMRGTDHDDGLRVCAAAAWAWQDGHLDSTLDLAEAERR